MFIKKLSIALLLLASWAGAGQAFAQKTSTPNVVIFFFDDMGYGDPGCYGGKGYATPNIDALAKAGMRFTDFYVSQPTCTSSRSSLLSGCYANRLGMGGVAYGPNLKSALPPDIPNMARTFKDAGYTTHLLGKWHLGSQKPAWPLRYGFDHYFGLPYSADMWRFDKLKHDQYPELPLIWDDSITVHFRDQSFLTRWYTQQAEGTIEKFGNKPLFMMMDYSLPHVPLSASPYYRNSTSSMYGDMMQELDWSVGRIIAKLKEQHMYENTIILLLSDNGPWRIFGNHGGSTGPLRGSKGTTWEGGVRVPFIASWPGKIPAGTVNHEYAMSIDIFPTLAKLIGRPIPGSAIIDGKNIWNLLSNEKSKTPHDALFFYYNDNDLEAVRYKQWKMYYPHQYRDELTEPGHDGYRGVYHKGETGLELYDLANDIGEKTNVASKNPEIIKEINALADKMREDLGDDLTQKKGSRRRDTYYTK